MSGGSETLGVVGFLVLALAGSAGEEVGWRGYALPQLQRRFDPLVATLIIAPVWWLWHLEFFVIDSLPMVAFVPYLVEVTCIAVILTWLYNGSGDSILLVIVWHAAINFVSVTETVATIISALAIVQGVVLVGLELRARRHGESVLRSRAAPRGSADEIPA